MPNENAPRRRIVNRIRLDTTSDAITDNPLPVSPVGGTIVSTANSSTTLINTGDNFTGTWEDVTAYDSVVLSVSTDQDGYYEIQFSPDGTNADSTLTRYYRIAQINVPHRFTITRKYFRVRFFNDSGTNQTYIRLQTLFGQKSELNVPCDSTVAQDFDATVVRPTSYNTEVALGLRQGHTLWNKFGYNQDVDVGTEVIASWGGTFTPLTTATTLTIVSTSANDASGGTGCNSIVVYGIDANRDAVIEVFTLTGTANVVSTSTWLGINRVAMFLCGTGQINAGTLNITATTGGSQMAQMPLNEGVTQQCIYHVPRKHTFVAEWVRLNILNRAKNAEMTIKMWVYSAVSNGKQAVYSVDIYTAITNDISENPQLPFPITEKTVVWLEATSDKADVIVNGRFSGISIQENDH